MGSYAYMLVLGNMHAANIFLIFLTHIFYGEEHNPYIFQVFLKAQWALKH